MSACCRCPVLLLCLLLGLPAVHCLSLHPAVATQEQVCLKAHHAQLCLEQQHTLQQLQQLQPSQQLPVLAKLLHVLLRLDRRRQQQQQVRLFGLLPGSSPVPGS